MVASREQILEHIRSNIAYLRKRYHVRKVALIGSFARAEQRPESDIDLLVDIEENTPDLFQIKRDLKRELEQSLGRPVELASERYLRPYYRAQVLQEAIYVQ